MSIDIYEIIVNIINLWGDGMNIMIKIMIMMNMSRIDKLLF